MINILFLGRDLTTIHIANYLKSKANIDKITIIDTNSDLAYTNEQKYQIIVLPLRGITNENIVPSLFEDLYLNKEWFQNLNPKSKIFVPNTNNIISKYIDKSRLVTYLQYNNTNSEENNIITNNILTTINHLPKDHICVIGYNEITKMLMYNLPHSQFNIGINSIFDWLQVPLPAIAFNTCHKMLLTNIIQNSDIVINTLNEHSITKNMISDPNHTYFIDLANYPYHSKRDIFIAPKLPHLNIWDLCELHSPYRFGKTLGKTIYTKKH